MRFAAEITPARAGMPSTTCIDKLPATPKDAARKNSLENGFGESRWKKDQSAASSPVTMPTARR